MIPTNCLYFLLLFASFASLVISCQKPYIPGYLRVNSPDAGTFEVYRLEGTPSTQLVSEDIGNFNERLELKPGSYLVLADCSSARVYVRSGELFSLTAHKVNFVPPHPPKAEDKFSVQCNRYEKLAFRQNLDNEFSFHILSGKRDLLVGLTPFSLDRADFDDHSKPKVFEFSLSALMVADSEKLTNQPPFFISPSTQSDLVALTQPQDFGQWQYLLPGTYKVELNGTSKEVVIEKGQSLKIEASLIQVKTPPEFLITSIDQRRDNSILINSNHLLKLDEITPILPGQIKINLPGSQEAIVLDTEENQIKELSLKSVLVDLGCSPWEWSCLGDKEVLLYHKDQYYPYLEGVTDYHILYLDDDTHIGFLSSKGIRYELPKGKPSITLKVGTLKIIPKPAYHPNQVTDLVRLEAITKPMSGHTLDVPVSNESNFTLVAGTYRLAQYNSSLSIDGERWMKGRNVTIKSGETTEITIQYFVTEKRYHRLVKAAKKKAEQRINSLSRQYQHAIPTHRF
ncbi:MAG: hypothetical protein R3B45_00850 [Bdellovibrionota bacterium]